MFDVIEDDTTVLAGVVVPAPEVCLFLQVDLEPYGEDVLSDEQLFMVARLEFQELQLRRTRGEDEVGPVLGSYRRPVAAVAELIDAALSGIWPGHGELAGRRERRMTAKTLRAALGGMA